jgi:hypothetical protein
MRSAVRMLVVIAVVGGTLLGARAAFAQRPYYGPAYGPPASYPPARYATPSYGGAHMHDGFFMRLDMGFGYLTASESYGGATDTYSGAGLSYGAAFGGVIAPNLILFGELVGTTVWDPDLQVTGTLAENLTGVSMTMFGIGPGIAYYFMPINSFVSASLLVTKISFTDEVYDVSLGDTDLGFGLTLMGGKEWWVSRDWGIGLAARLHFASMGDHPEVDWVVYDTRLNAVAFSLLFTATYN